MLETETAVTESAHASQLQETEPEVKNAGDRKVFICTSSNVAQVT